MTLIPGITTNEKNISSLVDLCKKLNITSVRLLPYHTLGKWKYAELGRKYLMKDGFKISDTEVQRIQQHIECKGVHCTVEGF